MNEEKAIIMHEKPYTIEIGHGKEHGTHVLIIKKIRVSGDDLNEVINMLHQALNEFETLKGEM